MGFSNGGYMAYRLACDLGSRITAFTSIAGNMFLDDDGLDCIDQEETFQFFIFMELMTQ